MNCNLSDQAGPGIKEEVTSPSWDNRKKSAASREKCFLTEDIPQKHDYIISSYEPLADLFFLYFNIKPNNKTKINNQKITRAVGGQPARLLGTFYIVTFLSLSHII